MRKKSVKPLRKLQPKSGQNQSQRVSRRIRDSSTLKLMVTFFCSRHRLCDAEDTLCLPHHRWKESRALPFELGGSRDFSQPRPSFFPRGRSPVQSWLPVEHDCKHTYHTSYDNQTHGFSISGRWTSIYTIPAECWSFREVASCTGYSTGFPIKPRY